MRRNPYIHKDDYASASAHPKCAHPECLEEGLHPGPTRHIPESYKQRRGESAKDALQDLVDRDPTTRPMYCKEHIAQINKGWNFFDGMEAEDIDMFTRDAVLGHRSTMPNHERARAIHIDDLDRIYQETLHMRDGKKTINSHQYIPTSLPKDQRDAIQTLELTYPFTREQLKKTYRTLVKRFHPDHKQGEDKRKAEEHIKTINAAYSVLKDAELVN